MQDEKDMDRIGCGTGASAACHARPGGCEGGQGGASFHIYGKIVALDLNALTIGVLVDSPDSLSGQTITVQTTAYTHFKECDGGTSVGIKFSDLEAGWQVRVAGSVTGVDYIATRVIQYVPATEE